MSHTSTRGLPHHPGNTRQKRKKTATWKLMKSNWALYFFLLPTVVYFIIFNYIPMYGIQIAFKNFSACLLYTSEHRDNITYINCYDLAVSAGTGEPLGDTYYKTRLEIPTERVPENAHYCLRVNGDSMEPAYRDGDIVFVERLDGSVSEGEIGIFFLNGEGFIKRLGDHRLISLNEKYPPILISDYDRLDCQGRVLGKL